MYVCVCMCCACLCLEMLEEVFRSLGLEFYAVVSHNLWVLRIPIL